MDTTKRKYLKRMFITSCLYNIVELALQLHTISTWRLMHDIMTEKIIMHKTLLKRKRDEVIRQALNVFLPINKSSFPEGYKTSAFFCVFSYCVG
jgi:hypothetical protein